MGIQTVGYRLEIIDTVLHLRRENERLINFPPLDHAAKKDAFGGLGGVGSKSTLNVQLNFGNSFYNTKFPLTIISPINADIFSFFPNNYVSLHQAAWLSWPIVLPNFMYPAQICMISNCSCDILILFFL